MSKSTIYTGPLENGAEVGSVTFKTPLPHEWNPSEADMKRNFPLHVALYDELGFAGGVLEVLRQCLWGVDSVLKIFEPVFAIPQQPPLPVISVPNIPA